MRTLFVLALVGVSTGVAARDYAVLADKSSLAFTATYEGEGFEGRFTRFTPRVAIDDADPANTKIEADIDMASANTDNEERDETLGTAEFFDTARYAQAKFRTTSCHGPPPKFECDATLTIRDRTQPMSIAFTLADAPDGNATLAADTIVRRSQFEVGTGDWTDTELIADEVAVRVRLVLKPGT